MQEHDPLQDQQLYLNLTQHLRRFLHLPLHDMAEMKTIEKKPCFTVSLVNHLPRWSETMTKARVHEPLDWLRHSLTASYKKEQRDAALSPDGRTTHPSATAATTIRTRGH